MLVGSRADCAVGTLPAVVGDLPGRVTGQAMAVELPLPLRSWNGRLAFWRRWPYFYISTPLNNFINQHREPHSQLPVVCCLSSCGGVLAATGWKHCPNNIFRARSRSYQRHSDALKGSRACMRQGVNQITAIHRQGREREFLFLTNYHRDNQRNNNSYEIHHHVHDHVLS